MNVEDLYRLLRSGHVQAQGIVDTIDDPMLVLDESLRVQAASRAFFRTFKLERDETIGRHVYDLGQNYFDIAEFRTLLSDVIPKSTAVIDYQIAADLPGLGRRTLLLTARTLFHPDSASHSLLLVIVDETDRLRRDATKDLLFGELRHRIKNLLAVAQSIARHTAVEGRSAQEYRDEFLGRFQALAEAQDLAFAEQEGGSLAVLVERILAPYAGDPQAVRIEPGADVDLAPRMVMSLALVLHELATNAAKYGALSRVGGQVRIGWALENANTQLKLTWVESGGPPVVPTAAPGYGAQLIQSSIAYSLGGRLEQELAASGLRVAIFVPLTMASAES
jgi:two-component sensor histidine kinase